MKTAWQTERGQLNHNWLQNGVLVSLNHALRVVDGKVRSANMHQTLGEDVARWQERRGDIEALLGRFEDEMSPKALFEHEPLRRCTQQIRLWLTPLVHELWMGREKVAEKIDRAMDAYHSAEQAYNQVRSELDQLPVEIAPQGLLPFKQSLDEFIAACDALSQSISALPDEIRCV